MRYDGWGADLRAGVVVALVALPLCLGIALASGAPLVAGLITGVIGGILVASIGGTSLLVSGPAAGLAAIVVAAIAELGSFQAFLAATAVAGVIQFALGLARTGRLAALVPSSVVSGMLMAIGVLLVLQQTPHALGVKPESAHGLEMLLVPLHAIPHAHAGPTLIGAICLALLLLWDRPFMSVARGYLPGPLLAVVVGTGLGFLLPSLSPAFGITPAQMVDLPDFSKGAAHIFTLPDFSALAQSNTWRVAVTLAVVASLETLLSMEATDQMDPQRRRSDADRELVAQGLGNTLAGLIGGLPMTGVIVRSAANVSAGGRSWRAAFAHGVVLAAAVAFLPWALEHIPLAALAAILLHTGLRLAAPSRFQAAFAIGRAHGMVVVTTIAAVVATDLLIGVGVGLLVSALVALVALTAHGVEITRESDALRLELADVISFVHKGRIHAALEAVPEGGRVTVDARRTSSVDHDVIDLLHQFARRASDRRIHVELLGVPATTGSLQH